ncbi:MAG: 1-deoxy-D-xylulose-5-phosphate synthase [Burkholderiales bacterium]|jgi:1-deoxy-D-xylulose-5-phosphate synthase|nr:1-deoxy-D-xylulose-5-phosphate synthase [Burkholderiales bacterium]
MSAYSELMLTDASVNRETENVAEAATKDKAKDKVQDRVKAASESAEATAVDAKAMEATVLGATAFDVVASDANTSASANIAAASLLDAIESPQDVRKLPREALPKLVEELRAFVLETVAQTGGHLSSNLGVIELTVALHYAFNTPDDRIIWDVGHQTYAHKALTGRRARLHTLRQKGGLSGFPSRSESEYDAFGTAHSSTSVSAALGMAVAAQAAQNDSRRVVAVIGDGAMSAGMAFEALNNAGAMDADLLVILNDNEMSISKPVGAFHQYLTRILTSPLYNSVRDSGKDFLAKIPSMKRFAKRMEEHTKGMLLPSTLFEEFGFFYVGPINGHDVDTLAKTLVNLRELKGPRLLHIVTEKGHGYAPAAQDPILYHGVTRFDPQEGIVPKAKAGFAHTVTYTEVFGQWLCDMARADKRLAAITPAMCEGSGLTEFAREFPQRYFDVGIAEQHAVTFAAGLACDGLKPVVAIYSTFLQRAYDQLIHDVALQNLPVVFAIDRAGIVGADGPTHIGAFDLSFMRCIPNLTIMAPADEAECRAMLTTAFRMDVPAAVRYPRGVGSGVAVPSTLDTLPVGHGEIRRRATNTRGRKIALLVFGALLTNALAAAEKLDATVANMRFVKPLDAALIEELANTHDELSTIEENVVMGGAGAAVAEFLSGAGIVKPILHLGLPDHFIEHGAPEKLLAQCELDAAGIVRQIQKWQARRKHSARLETQEPS